MAKNMAVRRAAKAQRRKAIVAQKRKVEQETNSIAGQARLVSAAPIQHCLLSEKMADTGMGILVLARGATPYDVTMATFLLDTLALGVKDVYLRSLGGREFTAHMEQMSMVTPMAPVDPAYARKLLHDLVAWSRSHGFNPHHDYVKVEPLFGATDPGASDATFAFGQDGKPLLVGDLAGAEWDSIEIDPEGDIVIDGDVVDASGAAVLEDTPGTAPHAGAD